jgi:hypothetical protein
VNNSPCPPKSNKLVEVLEREDPILFAGDRYSNEETVSLSNEIVDEDVRRPFGEIPEKTITLSVV